jgi:transposase
MDASPIPPLPLPLQLFGSLPELVRAYIRLLESIVDDLTGTCQKQKAYIEELLAQIHEYKGCLSKNSSNSSKPPGSDGLKRKTKSLRGKSGKKQGAQPGHAGKGLTQVDNPDVIVTHAPTSCQKCGSNLDSVNGTCAEKRQVVDLPEPKMEVTEHQAVEKQCPCCGEASRGVFPENVKGPVQYGERVQALAIYFAHQHFIPVDRVCQIFGDVFALPISPGTCSNIDSKLYRQLASFERELKINLLATKVLHFDETGMRCEKKLHWVHVASSQSATLYTIHSKRGSEAMDDAGILPHFQGTGVHDHWAPYFTYEQMTHSLCGAHHLRELTFIEEHEKESWAKEMKALLDFARKEVEKYYNEQALPQGILKKIEEEYTRIINAGFEYHALLPPLPQSKRGKQKQRDGKNLLDRLSEKRNCVLRFIHDFSVPFTNNLGEQDIRMVKLKQKISGSFRAVSGSQIFCRIRSYISTARKQGWSIWEALIDALKGNPRQLAPEQQQILPQMGMAQ